jgi:type IV secretory pathway VirB10-like protein
MNDTTMNTPNASQSADTDPRQALGADALDEANRRASPRIAVASGFSPGLAAGVCGIALLGVFTFSSLSAQRTTAQSSQQALAAAPGNSAMTPGARPAQNPNIIPVGPPDPTPVLQKSGPPSSAMNTPDYAPNYGAMPRGAAFNAMATGPAPIDPRVAARLQSPTLVVDLSKTAAAANAAAAEAGNPMKNGAQGLGRTISGEERSIARAGQLGNTSHLVPEGTVVAGTLETAINSDLPGHVRAVVSRDVMGFDGRLVLIPKGSRLVGQYQSGLAVGQSRTFIVWERLIRPDGVSVALASPGTDSLGRAGVSGKVDNHFMRRFGAAVLLSVIEAGGRAAAASNGNFVIAGGAGNAASAAGAGLQNDLSIPPTIKVRQGTAIRIFLNRDLDFSSLYSSKR